MELLQLFKHKLSWVNRFILFALSLALIVGIHMLKDSQLHPVRANESMGMTKIHTQSGAEAQVIQAMLDFLNTNQTAVAKMGLGQVTEVAVIPPYAVGKFVRGPVGGYMVLKHESGSWVVTTRRDDWGGLKAFVDDFGVPQEIAIQLLDQMFPDWRKWER